MLNAFTIDLEDWFQVSNVEHIISYQEWDDCEPRLVQSTRRALDLLARTEVRATFFVLGWNALRFPELVREVKEAGHEIASHGYGHRLVFEQTPEEFAADLAQATSAIQYAAGVRPRAYRAPSFSITPRSAWALAVLAEAGLAVDSSVFPIFHERYGFQGAPRLPHRVRPNGGAALTEVPPSTVRFAGRNFPFAGGAYFRLLPDVAVHACCRRLNRRGEPVIFYLHPWELDPGIPRFRLSPFRRLRSYANLNETESRLERLLRRFEFGTISELLRRHPPQVEWCPAVRATAASARAPAGRGSHTAVGRLRDDRGL